MANSILSTVAAWVTSSSVFSAVNDLTGQTLWAKMGILKVEVPSEAEATKQPLPNIQYQNSSVYQNLLESDIQAIKVMKPAKMRIVGICGDLSTLESVINSQKDVQLTLTVYTKSVIVPNMVISNVDFDQVPDKLSATQVTIELEQGIPPANTQYNPAQPGDQSQFGFRVQQPGSTAATIGTLFSKVASKVTNVIKPIAGALLGNKGEALTLDTSMLG